MPADRPIDLFDREREWADLSAFVSDPAPGLRLGIVYGRRRQGKSFLLRRLAAATGGFYYQALEHEPAQVLADRILRRAGEENDNQVTDDMTVIALKLQEIA